ncbi:sulfate adenylyltransferase subunit CysN [Rhizobium sp. ARZ01]|uniref:sulfate adenylyltransferase subunit CysN n=1 Tax=Rhizobium sp. ARZ01 TaxID=2769313 RepID=UPI001780A732|nr:sulfate adenylyltransferase subunit CysN [Rhizobium sp. ARZ01]MBD9373362.1 sulfate adenylyltransferase subunit CysN [Rhizobium sp. ARZ01]
MTAASADATARLQDYLADQEQKSLLRFITCGSVDDGKSTLIGRLLYDTKLILDDQLAALERDSARHGTTGAETDFALLLDGLEAEREQGITIDVAYRYFATAQRRFIVADTPGHEEYTRNMATGASTADLAVVLVDCRQGILQQTRRHAFIASLLGIRHVVLAVNKIDIVGYDQSVFDANANEFRSFAHGLDFETIAAIPISARYGDNVTRPSENMPWYRGTTLLEHLESVVVAERDLDNPFRLPVQLVSRPDQAFRGFSGQIASGRIAVGDEIVSAKSGRTSKVKSIVTGDGDLHDAGKGQAITVVLEDEIDISRGDMLAPPSDRPEVADQFMAHVIWFGAEPMIPGRTYILRTEVDSVGATVTTLKYHVDIKNFAHEAAKSLHMNEIGACNIATQAPIAFDRYQDNRTTGNFVLIDRFTNATIGAGMIDHPLRRATNIRWQALDIDRHARAALKHQKPAVLWLTGLSGAGKSTIANTLEKLLHAKGLHTYVLDGDNVRHGLNRDLGFTPEDRVENIRRIAEVAHLMTQAGLIVIVSVISPFRSERQMARELFEPGDFIEIFVDTPLEECARRDPKGLYKKAFAGELANFTGISSPYERPDSPEIRLQTLGHEPSELAMQIESYLENRSTRRNNAVE